MSRVSLEGYSPMDPGKQQNPYPYYEALREEAPVYKGEGGIHYVSSHAAVLEVLQQPNRFSSQLANAAGRPPVEEAKEEIEAIFATGFPVVSTMLTLDPPQQTRYRKSVGKAFSGRRIASLEPRIREIAVELLALWPDRGRVDFKGQIAVPFPVRVIADLLSVPRDREADVKRWSDASVASIGVKLDRESAIESARGVVEMQHFIASLLEARRAEPRDDFLTELVTAEFDDVDGTTRLLEIPEMISIVRQIMVAGNEATTKGITEIMKLLVENPEEWARLRDEPSRISAIAEEGLRLASPNQGLFRTCMEDTEVAGTKIARGEMLWVMFGSANRDPSVFPDPDRFDPDRKNLNDSLSFGRGAHFCIGAPLARLEMRVLFEELSKRIASATFAPGTTLEYEPSFILRGLKELEIEIVPDAH